MPRDFITLCTMIGSGTKAVPPGFVNQTLAWIRWHALIADRVVFYMDNLPRHIGNKLKSQSNVPVDIVYDSEQWTDPGGLGTWARQSRRFARCLRSLKGRSEWAGFIDTDEFVYPNATFRAAIKALPNTVDWVYLTWNHVCAATGAESYPQRYARSGKSFVRPEFFRDDRHEGRPLRTNGILSRKSNSVHRWVPLPGEYRAVDRMVTLSRSPHAIDCSSTEIGHWPCKWVSNSHELRHVRTRRAYRPAGC